MIVSENRWNRFIYEQVNLLVFEINLEVSRIVVEMEVKLEFFIVKLFVYEWYNFVFCLERKLKYFFECFLLYLVESYRILEKIQYSVILKEFKEFNKRKNY